MMAPWYIWKLRWKLFWDFRGLEALYPLGSFRVKVEPHGILASRWVYVNRINAAKRIFLSNSGIASQTVRTLGLIEDTPIEDVFLKAKAQAQEVLTGDQHLADSEWNRKRNDAWLREEAQRAFERAAPQPVHVKAYVLNGNQASIRCGCGWLAPTVRAHLETECSCNDCTQAEHEFQSHLEAKGALRHA